MSKEYIKRAFREMTACDTWSLQLLQIKETRKTGTEYFSRRISLTPQGALQSFVAQLSAYYLSEEGIDAVASVDDYTGDVVGKVIYKLSTGDALIRKQYDLLMEAIADPDTEIPIADMKPKAYLLKGLVSLDGEEVPVKLISMQAPVSVMRNRFLLAETGEFKEITDKVLTLRKTLDAAIIGDTFYLFTLAAERLFNMERSYKSVCASKVDEILKCDFLTNADAFKKVATTGQNPRRFVSYNQAHLEQMKNIGKRKKLAKQFGIALRGDQIDTEGERDSEKLVKLLCSKGMLDPFEDIPMEVAAAKRWR